MLSGMIDCLAVAVENAVLEWGDSLAEFFDKFQKSTLADSFSNQEPFVTTGITGEELVALINENVTGTSQQVRPGNPKSGYSEYYWVGYAVALFTALSSIPISKIMSVIPPDMWLQLYPIMHEFGDELLFEKLTEVYEKRL
jgi:hypothetical protein